MLARRVEAVVVVVVTEIVNFVMDNNIMLKINILHQLSR